MAYRILNGWQDWNDNIVFLYINDTTPGVKMVKELSNRSHYFYVEAQHKNYLTGLPFVKAIFDDDQTNGKFCKVLLNKSRDIYDVKDHLKRSNIQTFEADVSFVRKVMIDEQIKVGDMKTRKLFFDIETDDSIIGFEVGRDRVISVGAYDEDGNSYYFTDKDEKKLLENFLECMNNYDTLVSWNGRGFDIPVLKERFKKNNIYVDWRYWQSVDFLIVYRTSHQQKKSSYALDAVGADELGLPKIERDKKIIWLFENDPETLKVYNLRDVEIMYKLEKKLNLIKLQEDLATFGNIFISQVSATAVLDSLVLQKVYDEKLPYRYPNHGDYTKENRFEGGLVLSPKGGLFTNVIVIDFKSLYDRITQSLNMSPETLLKEPVGDCVKSPIGTYFRKDMQGILPQIMAKLSEKDEFWKKKILAAKTKEELSEAKMNRLPIKFMLKAFYGQMGSPYCRYYTPEIAATITGTGRWLTNRSVEVVQKEFGYEIMTTDTDSLHIKLPDELTAIETGQKIVKRLNELYEKWMTEECNAYANRIMIKFEKVYDKAIYLPDTKKRYVVHVCWEEGNNKDEIDWVGLEQVRGDWCPASKKLQAKIVEKIFQGKNALEMTNIIEEERLNCLHHKIPGSDLVISQALSQPPDEYASPTPVVRAAKKMDMYWIGMKIQYIITEAGEMLMKEYKEGSYDSVFYWNNKIFPPTQRILEAVFPTVNWGDYLLNKTLKISTDQTFLSMWGLKV